MNFYFEAAKVLDRIETKHGSIKGILASVDEQNRKRMTAAVIRTLEYKPVLISIVNAASLLKHERRHITSMNLALVLVHDLLFAKGIQAGDGPVKQAVLRHKTRLHSELVKIKIKKGVKENKDLARSEDVRSGSIPRYVRVNQNVGTTDEAIATLVNSKRLRLSEDGDCLNDSRTFIIDQHVPDLLAIHPSVTFQDDPSYLNGLFILQDKASCLPAAVLAPPPNERTVAIDATAAPGNKTSHMSSLMGNKGKIFAFERDKRRFVTLEKMLRKAQCRNVQATCGDFMDTNPLDEKYKDVSHILLDPSCSGSGIVNRLDYLMESENEEQGTQTERLLKLSEFQLSIIRHAMKFPSAKKIVYSTCSIHPEENEHVVREVLKLPEAIGRFTLAPRSQVLPKWERRGIPEQMYDAADASCLIRTMPGEDHTNGFFVAAFVRVSAAQHDASTTISNLEQARKRKHEGEEGAGDDVDCVGGGDEDGKAVIDAASSQPGKKKRKRKRKTASKE